MIDAFYGKEVIINENVVPDVPLSESEQLALKIYAKALKETYGQRIQKSSEVYRKANARF